MTETQLINKILSELDKCSFHTARYNCLRQYGRVERGLAYDYNLSFCEFLDQIGVDTKGRVKIYDYGYEQ